MPRFSLLLNRVRGLEGCSPLLHDAYESLRQVWFLRGYRAVFDIWAQLAREIDQSSSNRTMAEQRLNQVPLFNSEHLLSKAIPELVGGSINLCVQFSV